jgi:hypothetical protein
LSWSSTPGTAVLVYRHCLLLVLWPSSSLTAATCLRHDVYKYSLPVLQLVPLLWVDCYEYEHDTSTRCGLETTHWSVPTRQ